LWLYISGLAILIGAELNAEIEHASPYGKDPGEKVPGERKKIGAAAARAYNARLQQRPRPAAVPSPIHRPAAAFQRIPETRDQTLGVAIGLSLLLTRWWNQRGRHTHV
jgi:membrane protein